MSGRTYRVPKRVMDAVQLGMREYAVMGVRMEDREALEFARTLLSGAPVDIDVAVQLSEYLPSDWLFHEEKARVGGLYGGEEGRLWAKKCLTSAGLVASGGGGPRLSWQDDEELLEILAHGLDDDDFFDEVLAFGREPGEGEIAEELAEEAVEDVEPGPIGEELIEEVLEPHPMQPIALGVEVIDNAGEAGAVMSAGVELMSEDELGDAVEERMTVAAMREAIALATEAIGGGDGGDPKASGEPADGEEEPAEEEEPEGEEHHAANQLRDYHGRFAKVGARVEGKGGNLGWVQGADGDGNAIIATDAGEEVVIDPSDMRVVSVAGRGALAPNPAIVEDPVGRLEAYEAWANEQLGVTAAGEPGTVTPGAGPSPLFLAEVDSVDTSAVLALLAVVPTALGQGLRVFERRDGKWNEVPDYVRKFKSVSPPTVVELDRETLLAVVGQLDESDLGEKKEEPPAEEAPAEEVPVEEEVPAEEETLVDKLTPDEGA